MVFRIIAASLATVAIAAGTMGIGTYSEQQGAAYTLLQSLKDDGVAVGMVTCEEVQDHPEHPIRQAGGNSECNVTLTSGEVIAVPLLVFEDGSYWHVGEDYQP